MEKKDLEAELEGNAEGNEETKLPGGQNVESIIGRIPLIQLKTCPWGDAEIIDSEEREEDGIPARGEEKRYA